MVISLGAKAAEPRHLTHIYNPDDLRHIAAERFAAEVKQRTSGELDIKIHPASQMAGLKDGVEGVRLGTIDLTLADTGTVGNWAPSMGLFSLPFMFDSYEHAIKAMNGPIAEWRRKEILDKANLVSLSHAVVGFRIILTTKKEIQTAADLKGVKLRIPEIPVYVATFKALGTNATPVPWGETYSALQTGVVDGIESNPSSFLLAKQVEVTKFASKTNHILLDAGLLANKDFFASLSPETQNIVREAAKTHLSDWLNAEQSKLEDNAWVDISKRLKAVEKPDLAAFRSTLKPVWDDFIVRTKTQSVVDQINALRSE